MSAYYTHQELLLLRQTENISFNFINI